MEKLQIKGEISIKLFERTGCLFWKEPNMKENIKVILCRLNLSYYKLPPPPPRILAAAAKFTVAQKSNFQTNPLKPMRMTTQ